MKGIRNDCRIIGELLGMRTEVEEMAAHLSSVSLLIEDFLMRTERMIEECEYQLLSLQEDKGRKIS